MKKIYSEGHRGLCAFYPENTLLSFEAAMDAGLDAIEFDIWLSKDNIPVLMHDGNANRTAGVNKHLRDMTLDEIKELDPCFSQKFGNKFKGITKVPTLKELLDLRKEKKSDIKLGVEIKEFKEETVDLTVSLLTEYGLSISEDCWFYAFNGRIIRYLKEKYGARTMGYPDFYMAEFDGYDAYDEIGLPISIVRSEIFDFYAKKGLPIHMYCADTAEDVNDCIQKGAALITANNPYPLLDILKNA